MIFLEEFHGILKVPDLSWHVNFRLFLLRGLCIKFDFILDAIELFNDLTIVEVSTIVLVYLFQLTFVPIASVR